MVAVPSTPWPPLSASVRSWILGYCAELRLVASLGFRARLGFRVWRKGVLSRCVLFFRQAAEKKATAAVERRVDRVWRPRLEATDPLQAPLQKDRVRCESGRPRSLCPCATVCLHVVQPFLGVLQSTRAVTFRVPVLQKGVQTNAGGHGKRVVFHTSGQCRLEQEAMTQNPDSIKVWDQDIVSRSDEIGEYITDKQMDCIKMIPRGSLNCPTSNMVCKTTKRTFGPLGLIP
jgi:hypothetical protein